MNEGYAIFLNDDGTETKLSWGELQLEENGKKYGYKVNLIEDEKIQDNAFKQCLKIKEINIPEGITYIDYPFYGCDNLEKVALPSTIRHHVNFNGCNNLKEVSVNEEKAYLIKNVPDECAIQDKDHRSDGYAIFINEDGTETKLNWHELKLQKNAEKYGYDNYYLDFGPCPRITDNYIEDYTFLGNRFLKQICFPKTFNRINKHSFNGCKQLEKAILPPALKELGERSFASTAIKEIVIPDGTENVHYSAFYDCGIEKIVAPIGLKIWNIDEDRIERTGKAVGPLQEFYDSCKESGVELSKEEVKALEQGKFDGVDLSEYVYSLSLHNDSGERYFNIFDLDNFYNQYEKEYATGGFDYIEEMVEYDSYFDYDKANYDIKQITKYSEKLGIKPDLNKDPDELKEQYIEKIENKLQDLLKEHVEAKSKENERDNMPVHERS